MENESSPLWKKITCKACAVAVAGVCAAHALHAPSEQHQPVQFYQPGEHPERQPVPQPQQENQRVAVSMSSSAIVDDSGDAAYWMSVLASMGRPRAR